MKPLRNPQFLILTFDSKDMQEYNFMKLLILCMNQLDETVWSSKIRIQ